MSQLILPYHAHGAPDTVQIDGAQYVVPRVSDSGFPRQVAGHDALVRQLYDASVGVHALVARWTYTVPANTVAEVEHVFIHLDAGGAVGIATGLIVVQSAAPATIAYALRATANGATAIDDAASPHLLLAAGERLQGLTFNGGAPVLAYVVSAAIREYTL